MQIDKFEFATSLESKSENLTFASNKLNLICFKNETSKNLGISTLYTSLDILSQENEITDTNDLENNLGIESSNLNSLTSLSLRINNTRICYSHETKSILHTSSSGDLSEISSKQAYKEIFEKIPKGIFYNIFLFELENNENNHFISKSSLLEILKQLAINKQTNEIERSINLIDKRLNNYPYKGKHFKILDLLQGLQRGKTLLEERLIQLSNEKTNSLKQISKLQDIKDELIVLNRMQKRKEYFELCLETADLDSSILKTQERLNEEYQSQQELENFGAEFSNFPIEDWKKIQELITRKEARTKDIKRLEQDIEQCITDINNLESATLRDTNEIASFTIEEAHQLYSLARDLENIENDLESLQQKRINEMKRVKSAGVDFDNIALLRKKILKMDTLDIETGNFLSGEIRSEKEKLAALVTFSSSCDKQLKQITLESEKFDDKARKLLIILVALISIFLALTISIFLQDKIAFGNIVLTVLSTCLVLLIFAIIIVPIFLANTRKDYLKRTSVAKNDVDELNNKEVQISKKIVELQQQADKIATKYEFPSGIQFFKSIQSYGMASAQLKELDVLDQMIESRERQSTKICQEIESYFARINQKISKITVSATSGLADEVLRFKEKQRLIEKNNSLLTHKRYEHRFMSDELLEMEKSLKDFFLSAGIGLDNTIESQLTLYDQKIERYRKWEVMKQNYENKQKELKNDLVENDLKNLLDKLKSKQNEAWLKMQNLIVSQPELMSESFDDTELNILVEKGNDSSSSVSYLERISQLEKEKVELKNLILETTNNYEEYYWKTYNELTTLENEIAKIEHYHYALDLAKSFLHTLSNECQNSYASDLSKLSKEILQNFDHEIQNIEWTNDLNIKFTLRSTNETSTEEINVFEQNSDSLKAKKYSKSLIYQMGWLVKIILCRFIGERVFMPIILNEPFIYFDDAKFLACIKLLIHKIIPHCQIIIFSCHKARIEWLLNNLSPDEKAKLTYLQN